MMDQDLNRTGGTRGTWRVLLWSGLAVLLALPALAMSLGAEGVDWSTSDFVIAGVLLTAVGLGIEAMMRFVPGRRERWIAIAAIVVLFLLGWAELSVGLVGSPFAGS
jgi:hypothetical protein